MTKLYTVGHSNHTLKEFLDLLACYKINRVIDVRTIPKSRRNPWFSKPEIGEALRKRKIAYSHMPELGGLRHAKKDSINTAWKNESFRGYADYMQTKSFFVALFKLNKLLKNKIDRNKTIKNKIIKKRIAIMCAEAVPWRCHRNLIADAEVIRNIRVWHIVSKTNVIHHQLTSFAKIDKTRRPYRVLYPGKR